MLLYIITWTIIYFILILLLHNLYLFFQNNLTTTKTKDYYNFPNKEYNKINNILNSNNKFNENNLENKEKVNDKKTLYSNLNSFSNVNNTINPNYEINFINEKSENNLEETNRFNIHKFNSQFENNNMKGELEEFLNKLNN